MEFSEPFGMARVRNSTLEIVGNRVYSSRGDPKSV